MDNAELSLLYLPLFVALSEFCMSLGLSVPICEEGPAVPTLLSSPGCTEAGGWCEHRLWQAGSTMRVEWAGVDGVGYREGCSGPDILA